MIILEAKPETSDVLNQPLRRFDSDRHTINSQVEILQSSELLGKVVEKLNLHEDADFMPAFRKGEICLQKWCLFKGLVEHRPTRSNGVAYLKLHLHVQNIPLSSVISITAQTKSAKQSNAIANEIAETYISEIDEAKSRATEKTIFSLAQKVGTLKAEINTLELAQTTFEYSNLEQSRLELERKKIRLAEITRRIARIDEKNEDYLAQIERIKNQEMTQELWHESVFPLLQGFQTDRELDFDFEKNSEKISSFTQVALETELKQKNTQVGLLVKSKRFLENEVAQDAARLLEFQEIEREKEVSLLVYETLLTRLKEASALLQFKQSAAKVISKADSESVVVRPNIGSVYSLFMLCGLAVGIAHVLAKNHQDRNQISNSMLQKVTQRPILAKYQANNYALSKQEDADELRNAVLYHLNAAPIISISLSALNNACDPSYPAMLLIEEFAKQGKKILCVDASGKRDELSTDCSGLKKPNVFLQSYTGFLREMNSIQQVEPKQRYSETIKAYDLTIFLIPSLNDHNYVVSITKFVDKNIVVAKEGSIYKASLETAMNTFSMSNTKVDGFILEAA